MTEATYQDAMIRSLCRLLAGAYSENTELLDEVKHLDRALVEAVGSKWDLVEENARLSLENAQQALKLAQWESLRTQGGLRRGFTDDWSSVALPPPPSASAVL